MKQILTVALFLFAMGCTKTKTVVVETPKFDNTTNEQRLTALEAAVQINYTNDALLAARVDALENLQRENEQRIYDLQQDLNYIDQQYQAADEEQRAELELERQARLAKDEDLQRQIDEMKGYVDNSIYILGQDITQFVNSQITMVNTDVTSLSSRVLALESVNNTLTMLISQLQSGTVTREEFEAYQALVASVYATKDMLSAVDGRITNLATQVMNVSGTVTNLQTVVSGLSSMSLVKAPCNGSTEVYLKVGTKFYGNIGGGNGVAGILFSYLSELTAGVQYRSNDGTNCKFKVLNGTLVEVL